jgi:hypothetical protein
VQVDARHALLEFSKPIHCTLHETPGTPMSFISSDSEKKYYTRDGKVPDDKMFHELSDIFKPKMAM